MVGVPFQIQRIAQLAEHFGLAGAGHAAQQYEITLGSRLLQGFQQEGTHGLVATADAGVFDARFGFQPLLHDLRTQAAPKAVQVAIGVSLGKLRPLFDALGLDRPGHQLMPQHDRRLLALLLVTGADPLALIVGHQRQVDHPGERALGEFDRRAGIHHRPVVEENVAVIGDVRRHQITSTALVCRSSSSPIGSRARPSSAATAWNSASPSGVTAISRPPLVWGSHSTRLCSSCTRPSLLA